MTGDPVDIAVGLYALRTFRFDPVAMRAYSVAVTGSHWQDGTCTAECRRDDPNLVLWNYHRGLMKLPEHEAPDIRCQCGVYGALSLSGLRGQYPNWARRCVAVIAAEGPTIAGPRGLRTQYARVVAYWTPSRNLYRAICKRQFKGAQSFTTTPEMLEAYHLPADGGERPDEWKPPVDWWNEGQRRIV